MGMHTYSDQSQQHYLNGMAIATNKSTDLPKTLVDGSSKVYLESERLLHNTYAMPASY